MPILGPSLPPKPTWWSNGRLYYTTIRTAQRSDAVEVWSPPADGEVTPSSPGTLRLQLEPISRGMRITDEAGQEQGRINAIFPKLRYSMKRDGNVVWELATRSPVLRRHTVEFSSGDSWSFHTPFYWWLNVLGLRNGAFSVLGWVGPTKTLWGFAVDPECDHPELLAALAMLHRNWWRS